MSEKYNREAAKFQRHLAKQDRWQGHRMENLNIHARNLAEQARHLFDGFMLTPQTVLAGEIAGARMQYGPVMFDTATYIARGLARGGGEINFSRLVNTVLSTPEGGKRRERGRTPEGAANILLFIVLIIFAGMLMGCSAPPAEARGLDTSTPDDTGGSATATLEAPTEKLVVTIEATDEPTMMPATDTPEPTAMPTETANAYLDASSNTFPLVEAEGLMDFKCTADFDNIIMQPFQASNGAEVVAWVPCSDGNMTFTVPLFVRYKNVGYLLTSAGTTPIKETSQFSQAFMRNIVDGQLNRAGLDSTPGVEVVGGQNSGAILKTNDIIANLFAGVNWDEAFLRFAKTGDPSVLPRIPGLPGPVLGAIRITLKP